MDFWTSAVAVLGGLYLAAIGRYAYMHADDTRYASGGLGSSMSPSTRRFGAVLLVVTGVGMAVVTALF